MKNITVSLDDEIYRRARVHAAAQDTSVSALVRGFLEKLSAGESTFDRLAREEQELRRQLDASGLQFSASDRLTRDEIHDRDALRRHEHSAL